MPTALGPRCAPLSCAGGLAWPLVPTASAAIGCRAREKTPAQLPNAPTSQTMPYSEDGIGFQNVKTSEQAAHTNVAGKRARRWRVLGLIESGWPATSYTADEMAELFNLAFHQVAPCFTELQRDRKSVV